MDHSKSSSRKLHILGAGLIGAFLFATPAQAQRTSLDSLAGDHDGLATDHNDIQSAIGAAVDGTRTPIGACGIIDTPGSYVVTQNLNSLFGCLAVTADIVTIDLGGHTIAGAGTGVGSGISAGSFNPSPESIAIYNGVVIGFEEGINLLFADRSVVRDVRVLNNSEFGILVGLNSIVTGNTADANGNGILTQVGALISGNTAGNNTETGIGAGCPSNVFNNVATGNADNLVLFGDPADCNDVNNLAP